MMPLLLGIGFGCGTLCTLICSAFWRKAKKKKAQVFRFRRQKKVKAKRSTVADRYRDFLLQ